MSHFNASVGPKSHLHIKSRRWDSFDMPIKWSRLCKSMTNSQRKETPNNKFSFGAACSRRLFGCQRRPKKKKKNYSNRQLCVECRAHPAAGIPLVGGAPHNTRSQRGQICLSWYAKHHRRHFIVIIIIAVPTITWSFIHSLHSTRNSQLIRLSKKSQINSILFFYIKSPRWDLRDTSNANRVSDR